MFRELSSFSKITFLASAGLLSLLVPRATEAQPRPSSAAPIYAQKLVEETLAAHPELAGLELAATPPTKSQCVTIASSEAKGIGEKCDKDEYSAMKNDKPFVEKEKENGKQVYDVTIPIHDADGKVIATAGIDFKPWPDQAEAWVTDRSRQIAREIESKIKSKEKLFQPVV
jgi:iron complex outermembrane receptor protein